LAERAASAHLTPYRIDLTVSIASAAEHVRCLLLAWKLRDYTARAVIREAKCATNGSGAAPTIDARQV
jgi:hypothetical protein